MITLNSILTVFFFILFIAIVVWAWSSKRKAQFDEAARLPMDDDDLENKGKK